MSLETVVENLRRAKGFRTDAQVAAALGLSPTSFSYRRSKDSVPYQALCEFCLREGISLDAVLGISTTQWLASSQDEREVLASFRALPDDLRRAALLAAGCFRREFSAEEPPT